MSSSSVVGNGARGRGIVRHCGGRGSRGIGRGGLGGRGGVLEDPLPLRPRLALSPRDYLANGGDPGRVANVVI
jgi:hypothetical protein